MKKNITLILSIIFGFLAILITILVLVVDRQNVGLNGTALGFATINTKVFDIFKTNDTCKLISNILGFIAIGVAFIMGFIGFVQLFFTRKNFFKVDKKVVTLGYFFTALIILYFVFMKLTFNYRTVFEEDGSIEASFPSSHTFLMPTIFLCSIGEFKDLIKNKKLAILVEVILIFFAVTTVTTRFLAGVHWLTDILGGLLYCLFATSLYYYVNRKKENGNK